MAASNDVEELFEDVLHQIIDSVKSTMEQVWSNWAELGIDHEEKVINIKKMVGIEASLHKAVIEETAKSIVKLKKEIQQLKQEAQKLSTLLSIDISITENTEGARLCEYKESLENQISTYRAVAEQRHKNMERLLEWQHDLTETLGITLPELSEIPLPSEEELNELQKHLANLQAERDKRIEIFLNAQVEIKDMMNKLCIKPSNKFEQMVVTYLSVDFKVTDLNMDRLRKLEQDLQQKYEETNNRVLELRERLSRLWECLEEDRIYCDNFLQAHPGCHPDTEAAIKEEIKRCEQIKRQKIQVFVANIRTKIKLAWDDLMYSPQQREEFIHYHQEMYTEDTLTLHERYLEKLKKFYNENKQIFDLVVTRKNLWNKMTELEARASEPGRYHNRGGQLLKEEKERKTIVNNLPKIEAQIIKLVEEYENNTNRVFTIEGKPLKQLIEDDWESRKAERQNKLSARKRALTPGAEGVRSYAPSSFKRSCTVTDHATPSNKNRVIKRQFNAASATKAQSPVNNQSGLKRCASTTVKRRISGRLQAARSVAEGLKGLRKKLDYELPSAEGRKTPKSKPKVICNILKHKRVSGNRRSSQRLSGQRRTISSPGSISSSGSTVCTVAVNEDPAKADLESTTYTDFRNNINENQICRSSLAIQIPDANIISDSSLFPGTPQTQKPPATPRRKDNVHMIGTPKNKMLPQVPPPSPKPPATRGKENLPRFTTPKNNVVVHTPSSAQKDAAEQFATPRAPLGSRNIQVSPSPRSKSHLELMRTKKLPPLM